MRSLMIGTPLVLKLTICGKPTSKEEVIRTLRPYLDTQPRTFSSSTRSGWIGQMDAYSFFRLVDLGILSLDT